MKLYNIDKKELGEILGEVENCTGKVTLMTEDGASLDLKENLAKVTKFLEAVASRNIPKLEIVSENREDGSRLAARLLKGIA